MRQVLYRTNIPRCPQTNGKLERFYGVYDQPHLSLNYENLETPIQAASSQYAMGSCCAPSHNGPTYASSACSVEATLYPASLKTL